MPRVPVLSLPGNGESMERVMAKKPTSTRTPSVEALVEALEKAAEALQRGGLHVPAESARAALTLYRKE